MTTTKEKVALVTGGAGFIGSHMVDLLLDLGFTVRVIDNLVGGREANLAQHRSEARLSLDRRDIRQVEATDPLFTNLKFIFHFAGIGDIVPSIDKPFDYMDTNVIGTVRMLEGAREGKVEKFVYAASSSCYGLAEHTPTKEDEKIRPEYPYALSKFQGEQATFHWGKVYKLPVNSIRIFNAYGTRSRTTGAYGAVFGVFLKQKLAGKPFTVVGDGTQTRDFIYCTDIAKAFFAAANTEYSNEVFNLGAGNPQSVNHLIQLLGGGKVEHLPKRPGEPECTWADITKLKTLLNWSPTVSFEQGVANILEQIDYWKDAPLWDRESISKATAGWFEALS